MNNEIQPKSPEMKEIRLEKKPTNSVKKPIGKGALIAIISTISALALVLIIGVTLFLLMPNDERSVKNILTEISEAKSITMAVDMKDSSSQDKPTIDIDLENKAISANVKTKISGKEIFVDIYGKDNELYMSGKSFSEAFKKGIASSLTASDASGILDNMNFGFENGWVETDTTKGSMRNYSAKVLIEKTQKTFDEMGKKDVEIEVKNVTDSRSGKIYSVIIEGKEIKISVDENGKFKSLESVDGEFIRITNLNKAEVKGISGQKIYTQAEVTKITMDKFITSYIDDLIKKGKLPESQRSALENLLKKQYVEQAPNSGLSF